MDTQSDTKQPVRRVPLALGIAAVVLVADQATKYWAERTLTGRDPIPVIGDVIQFRLLYNPGAAFSMGESVTWVFTIIAAIAAGWLFWYLLKPHPKSLVFAFSLLLGGATTHLLDRLFRDPGFARGHVVDFIDYNGWFVGNVADIALTFGALLAFVLTARQKDPAEEPAGEPAESRD
ncbi:signal peptidase II [Actinophytocola algeriensis]|uniref:Lipoprotein signal peptidase n=1 Tax=Actinophytocola algeriensis TaxID=1768010 RepID=A0A7W7VDP6_9PSEU|nr:signal peptidase II [Actinophytocola algeriensis]MBB4906406.1 signal peptidase II [Actinophytocola algeriensis]MBE1477887.1 signal peptidase II [Actinophytocola algeriensis]